MEAIVSVEHAEKWREAHAEVSGEAVTLARAAEIGRWWRGAAKERINSLFCCGGFGWMGC